MGPNYQPPAPPWHAIHRDVDAGGYVSVYYSDILSRYPIRAISRPGDHKADPNLETKTYGMFSTCSPDLRRGIVDRGATQVFFGTHFGGRRVLAGYYDFAWYAPAVSQRSRDFCVASETIHWVANPIPFSEVDRECGSNISRRFRLLLRLTPSECASIRSLLEKQPDATQLYVSEIYRIERFNHKHTGYHYPTWKRLESFSWDVAPEYLQTPERQVAQTKTKNASATGRWRCGSCNELVVNKALLRRCPACGELATLSPEE